MQKSLRKLVEEELGWLIMEEKSFKRPWNNKKDEIWNSF